MKKYFKVLLFLLFFTIFLLTFNFRHNNKVSNKNLLETTTTATYAELFEKLDTFLYNLSNPEYLVNTNKFLCTGTDITCADSSTYSKVGLINLAEYNAVGGSSSYVTAKNNYWTMSEEGTAAHNITAIGSSLVPKESYSGVRPAIYIQNSLKVTGSGAKNDPYVLSKEIDYYVDGTGANHPELASNMVPIKRSGNIWVKADVTNKWYNYANQEWANAVLVKETGTNTRDYYLSRAATGKEVKEEDILAYFVWIPRYAYKIATCYHNNCNGNGGTIGIRFLIEKTNTTLDGTTIYEDSASNTHFVKHPAFNFGGTELKGIWVAKFEASSVEGSVNGYTADGSCSSNNDNVTIKTIQVLPNKISWRCITVDNMFTNIKNMETNSLYGWGTSGNSIDTHLIKNTEWGVVGYLSKSQYGKNTDKIWINPANNFTTGCSGDSAASGSTVGCLRTYETTNGVNASTTGNIYGIYDISGGAWEYVAAYIDNADASLYGSSLISAGNQYNDLYEKASTDNQANNYNLTANKSGDALWETSNNTDGSYAWFDNYTFMSYANIPWFMRGGWFPDGQYAGAFSFTSYSGNTSSLISFRPTLLVDSSL